MSGYWTQDELEAVGRLNEAGLAEWENGDPLLPDSPEEESAPVTVWLPVATLALIVEAAGLLVLYLL